MPEAALRLAPIGRVDPGRLMRLALSLPWRDPEGLKRLLSDLADPRGAQFRRYLTPAEFVERFGPTEADYRRVQEFARTNGLTVTHTYGNRMLVDVIGAAADVEHALNLSLHVYQHPTENRTFFAPASEPSVDPGTPLLDVSGLDDFHKPRPSGLHRVPPGGAKPSFGSGPDGGDYTAKDIRAAYAPGVALTGAGQTVGLLEFDGFYAGDIVKYRQASGLAAVPIQTVLLDGFNGVPTTGTNSGNGEVALDIEMVLALAPGVSQILVYESDPNATANDLLGRMVTDNLAAQLSSSWSFGTTPSAATDQLFQQMAAQGQSFFQASGDSGAFLGSTIQIPQDSPYVTQVGATTLTTTGPGGGYVSETVWNAGQGAASSGGVSLTYTIPAWQKGVSMTSNGGSTTHRNVPDVAMLGDNVYTVADDGANEPVSGTSCAAPLWAALAALANQKAASLGQPRIGFVNPALYALFKGASHSSYFRDIATGNNSTPASGGQYRAVAGYDLCTGMGTPIVATVASSLALTDTLGITPFAGFTAHGPLGGPFDVAAQTLGLTNAGGGSLGWAVGGLPAWLTASASHGLLASSGAGATLTLRLTEAAKALPVGVSTAELGFTNQATGSVQTRTVTLSIGQNLVQNGGFETGDFAYWTLSGSSADQYCYVDDGTYTAGLTPHTGSWAASLGQSYSATAAVAYLAQTLPTLPNQSYLVGFWLSSLPGTNGATLPNRFQFFWGGSTAYSVANQPASGWTHHQYVENAAGPTTVLKFGSTDDPGAWGLDDVTVTPIPEPAIQSVTESQGSLTLKWSTQAGVSYQVQSSTALSPGAWTGLGSAVVAGGSSLSYTDSSPSGSQRFYRVVISP